MISREPVGFRDRLGLMSRVSCSKEWPGGRGHAVGLERANHSEEGGWHMQRILSQSAVEFPAP